VKLRFGQLKEKVVGKSIPIPFDRLVKAKRRNSIDSRKISIENDTLIPDNANRGINVNCFCLLLPSDHSDSLDTAAC